MNAFEWLFYLFVVVVIIQSLYYFFIFGKFVTYKQPISKPSSIPISVIICAKNEAEHLQNYMPLIGTQDYPTFEIILVNDDSSDNSLEIMESFSKKYPHINIVDVQQNEAFWGNKKYALTLGIKAAKHENLLLTDADCKPLSKHWITSMSSLFTEEKNIILGYGAYMKNKYSLLNKLIRFETLLTAVQYFSYALIGEAYMGVGRNLAYTKTAFFSTNGFAEHMDVLSGDDDLFINQIASKDNVAITISPYSFTKSQPEKSYKTWFKQKKRHVSTAFKYKPKHKFMLGLFYLSQLFFWSLGITLLINQYQFMFVTILFMFILLTKYIIFGLSAKKLREKDLILFLPVLELFLICFQLAIFISNLFSKQNRWK